MAIAATTNDPAYVEVDGSAGAGQFLRVALSLSLCTQKPFHLKGLRAGRLKPGLLRQHLTLVSAAAALSNAEVREATLGSTELYFAPRGLRGGNFAFSVGGLGSSMQLLQTLLMPLALSGVPSELILEGSTHTAKAPNLEYMQLAYLPLLRSMGIDVQLRCERRGFSKTKLGRVIAQVMPSRPQRLSLLKRGELRNQQAKVLIGAEPRALAEQQLMVVKRALRWPVESYSVEELAPELGAANVLVLTLENENLTEVFSAVGERGLKGDPLAEQALQDVRDYLSAQGALGPYLAEHMLLPSALAGGGEYSCTQLSDQLRATAFIAQQFLGVKIHCQRQGSEGYLVRIT